MPTNPSLAARRKVLGAAVETTKGTAEAMAAAMASTIVYDAKMKPDGMFDDGERAPNLLTGGTLPRTKGLQKGTLTFRTEMLHDDQFMTLIQGCGFSVATGTGGIDTATPTTDLNAQKTLTFELWEGGRRKILYGANGTFTLEAAGAAQRVFCSWEFSGIFETPDDEAMPSTTPTLTKGYRAQGMTFTFAAAAIPPMDGFTLAMNADVQPREDLTTATGLGYFIVGDVVPTLSIAPEARTVAQYDTFGKLLAGTAEALSIVLTDDSSNTLTIASPKAQRTDVDDGDRNSKLTDPIEMDLHVSAGNDQVTFTESA